MKSAWGGFIAFGFILLGPSNLVLLTLTLTVYLKHYVDGHNVIFDRAWVKNYALICSCLHCIKI